MCEERGQTGGWWLYEAKGVESVPSALPARARLDEYAGMRMRPTGQGISCPTVESGRIDALKEWFADGAATE